MESLVKNELIQEENAYVIVPVMKDPTMVGSAFKRGEMVSERPVPGQTDIATIFEFCDF